MTFLETQYQWFSFDGQTVIYICWLHFCSDSNRHIQDAHTLLNVYDNSIRFTLETKVDGHYHFFGFENFKKYLQTGI
jgi:hypothetical protein